MHVSRYEKTLGLCKCTMAFSVLFSVHFPGIFYHVLCSLDGCWMPRWHFHGSASHTLRVSLLSGTAQFRVRHFICGDGVVFFSVYIALYLPRWKFTCHLFAQSLLLENPSTVLHSQLSSFLPSILILSALHSFKSIYRVWSFYLLSFSLALLHSD